MKPTYEELGKRIQAILAKAYNEGDRPLTEEEQAVCSATLATMKRMKEDPSSQQKRADEAFRDQLKELGLDQPEHGGGAPPYRSGRRSVWGDLAVKAAFGPDGRAKALTSGTVTVPSLTGDIVRAVDRPARLLELIPASGLMGTDTYSYLLETVRTNNAAPVAAGALKPTSVYTVARVDDRVRTVAHLSERIPRQTLADVELLRQYVEGSLRQGVIAALEVQIVSGSGVGENLTGLATTSGIQVQALGTDTRFDAARKAITKLEAQELTPAFFVLNPADWEAFELTKDTAGNYLAEGSDSRKPPIDPIRRLLWGVPVAATTAAAENTGYLVAEDTVRIWEREAVMVDWSEATYDSVAAATDFERNLVRFRAEGRFGFAVQRPVGVVQITGL